MSNAFLNGLKNETNVAYTTNGAKVNKTTRSLVLDFFAIGGAMRQRSERDIMTTFQKALSEDALLATKAAFYFRDIRGGQGERRTFRTILTYLAVNYPQIVRKNLELIPVYGRWDDLYSLFDTPLESEAGALIRRQFRDDLKAEQPSLLGKWLKSENASSHETIRLARKTRKYLELSPRNYRKALSGLRYRIHILETQLSKKDYSFDYSKLPSGAGLKYRQAFHRNDSTRYTAFLDSLKKGDNPKVKINTKTLYPYEIVRKIPTWGYGNDATLDALWDNLPDYFNGVEENSLVVVDTSGSMNGTPREIAVSLGIYVAERNKGVFHNHFITFSERPRLQQIVGNNISEKVRNLDRAQWDMNTNIEAVFDLILTTAIKNNLPQDEMVQRLYIVSDMQFDRCIRGGNDAKLFDNIRQRYESKGYQLPRLVFWNVNASNSNFPMTMLDHGVQLVSGASPSIFTNLLKGTMKSAYEMMLDVLSGERYEAITV